MPKPPKPRATASHKRVRETRMQYESGAPERRPVPGAQRTPRLGPYEFQYTIELGYSAPNPALLQR